jgi:hypothetical protein
MIRKHTELRSLDYKHVIELKGLRITCVSTYILVMIFIMVYHVYEHKHE